MIQQLPVSNYTQFARKKAKLGIDPYLPKKYRNIVLLGVLFVAYVLKYSILAMGLAGLAYLLGIFLFKADMFFVERHNLQTVFNKLLNKAFIDNSTQTIKLLPK